jgi:hypothetical protein
MTKREFLAKYGKDVVELLGNNTLQIALSFLRENCPFLDDKSTDPTSIIRNEGKIQGWNKCLTELKNLWEVPAEAPPVVPGPLYQDPDRRKSDQNKK